MVPAILAPAVLARFGPWLGRIVRAKPGVLATLITRLRAAGAVVGDGVSGVITYFKSSPTAAALTLATMAGLGVSVAELFEGEDKDDELDGLLRGLDRVSSTYTARQRGESMRAIQDVGARSEHLRLGIADNEVKTLTAIEVLSWARSHFGSPTAAMAGHRLMQAFVEMPYEDVRTGFATLRLN